MNKIYKVVWSKVKNCYVVVSEIAKNVISGSVKSARIGAAPVVKGMALGALMALVITGNAWAQTIILNNDANYSSSLSFNDKNNFLYGEGYNVTLGGLQINTGNLLVENIQELTIVSYGRIEARNEGTVLTLTGIGNIEAQSDSRFGGFIYNDNAIIDISADNIVSQGGVYAPWAGSETTINVTEDFVLNNKVNSFGSDNRYEEHSTKTNISAKNIEITYTDDEPLIEARESDVYVSGNLTINAKSDIDAGNVDTSNVEFGNKAYGVAAYDNSNITLTSTDVVGATDAKDHITISAVNEDGGAIGIYACVLQPDHSNRDGSSVLIKTNNLNVTAESGDESQPGSSIRAKDGSKINVIAENAILRGEVYASDNSTVDMSSIKNLELTADRFDEYVFSPVVQAEGSSNIIIGSDDGNTVIKGDIVSNSSTVDLKLGTNESILIGRARGNINVELEDGATWRIYDDYPGISTVNNLTMNNGVLELLGYDTAVSINKLATAKDVDVAGTIVVRSDGENILEVDNAEQGTVLRVSYDGREETIEYKKEYIKEKDSKINNLVIGDAASNIQLISNSEIRNTKLIGTYTLDSNDELTVKLDAENLKVSGDMEASTFNGIDLNSLSTKAEVVNIANGKADKATTLAGYGITDAYTQAEVNAKIEEATSGLSSGANLTDLQNKVQNISNETTANKTVVTGDVEVRGTYNGLRIEDSNQHSDISILIGNNDTVANPVGSVAIGDSAKAYGDSSIAIGLQTVAEYNSVAVGYNSIAEGYNSVAIGDMARTTHSSIKSVALGHSAVATGENSVAIGASSAATIDNTVSVGSVTNKRKIVNVAAGDISSDSHDAVIGSQLYATNLKVNANEADISNLNSHVTNNREDILLLMDNVTDINVAVNAKADKATTLEGYGITDAYTKFEVDEKLNNKVSVGKTDDSTGFAVGEKSIAEGQAVSVGYNAESDFGAVAIGYKSNAYSSGVAIGQGANAKEWKSVAIGDEVNAEGLMSIAIGNRASAKNDQSIAIGAFTDATLSGIAVGKFTHAGNHAVGIGIWSNSETTGVAIGHKSNAAGDWGSVAIGAESVANDSYTVSFGHKIGDKYNFNGDEGIFEDERYRRLINVADGINDHDVVTVGQLNSVVSTKANVSDVYTKAEVDTALDGKVNRADSLAGYGITDAYTQAEVNAKIADATSGLLTDSNLTGKADKADTLSGYGITDAYTKAEVNAKIADATSGLLTDANLTGKADKADTLAGYGISDAYTKDEVNAKIADATSGLMTDANLTGKADKADTLAGYGITDAYTKAEADAAMEIKVDTKVGEVESAYKQADNAINESINAMSKAYADADVVLENRVTNAYKVADTALESKVTDAYKSADEALRSSYETADTALSGRIDATQASIALKANIVDVYTKTVADAKFAVKASTLSGYGITDAYTQAEVNARIADATSGLLTDANLADKADRSYVDTGIGNVTSAYKSADTALSNRITANEESINALIEDINSIEVGSGTVSNKALETKLTNAYKEADTALETKITKGYQAVGNALSVRIAANETNLTAVNTKISSIDKEVSNKADKSTTLKGYGITDTYTKAEIDNKLNSATKSTVSDRNIIELKNKTKNISEETTEGNTVVNGDVEVLGNITAQYAEFVQGASFANNSVRISSDGIVRFGGSGKTSNVTIYSTGSTSIDAKGAVVAGSVVSNGQVEASGNIITTTGDVMAGNVSLKETAQALEGKADKADTLDGYGITDAYTKAEVDSKFDDKVDAKDVYTKADVDNKLADKVDKTYVDSNFAKVGDVYTKEEADATFVKRTELATIDENGNVVAISTKTELNRNFVVEDGVNGTEISINKGTDSQIIIGADGSMLFGTNSTQIDDNGVFAGRIDMGENDPHNYANAQAAINQDGYIKGASGKFEVNGETGNVTGGTYNGVKLEHNSDGEAIINDVNINQMSAQVGSNAESVSALTQRLGKISGKLNKVGAGAAALAALHPLEYDPDDKLTFSAGVGNYAGENAAALGAFYRPDEKLMFSIGGTMGNGENMVNLGVSIGLDGAKGTPKLSRKELIQIVGTMHEESKAIKAENDAIKAENEALEERVAKLEALVAKLAEK